MATQTAAACWWTLFMQSDTSHREIRTNGPYHTYLSRNENDVEIDKDRSHISNCFQYAQFILWKKYLKCNKKFSLKRLNDFHWLFMYYLSSMGHKKSVWGNFIWAGGRFKSSISDKEWLKRCLVASWQHESGSFFVNQTPIF